MNTFYWSRKPGNFLNEKTGELPASLPKFTGSVREWYETLVETICRALLRIEERGPVTAFVSNRVLTILECSVLYRPELNNRFVNTNDFPENSLPPGIVVGTFNSLAKRTVLVTIDDTNTSNGNDDLIVLKIGDRVMSQVFVKDLNII